MSIEDIWRYKGTVKKIDQQLFKPDFLLINHFTWLTFYLHWYISTPPLSVSRYFGGGKIIYKQYMCYVMYRMGNFKR